MKSARRLCNGRDKVKQKIDIHDIVEKVGASPSGCRREAEMRAIGAVESGEAS